MAELRTNMDIFIKRDYFEIIYFFIKITIFLQIPKKNAIFIYRDTKKNLKIPIIIIIGYYENSII